MEKIFGKIVKMLIIFLTLIALLIITNKVFAASISKVSDIKKGDTIRLKSGYTWTVYNNSNCTSIYGYIKGAKDLKILETAVGGVAGRFKVSYGTVTNKYVKIGSGSLKYYEKISSAQTSSNNNINTKSISLSGNTKMKVGDTQNLKVTIDPSNATNKTVTYSSNATSVATVNTSGKVTAKKAGTAKITAKCDGKTATLEITVENNNTNNTTLQAGTGETATKVYLTNYKPSDGGWENLATAYAGTLLEKQGNTAVIKNSKVKVNNKGWYTYTINGKDYVILARLKDKNGSYCGIDKCEVIKFKYNNVIYSGIILDCGGAKRKYPTLDIFRTIECKDAPGLVETTVIQTNVKLSL